MRRTCCCCVGELDLECGLGVEAGEHVEAGGDEGGYTDVDNLLSAVGDGGGVGVDSNEELEVNSVDTGTVNVDLLRASPSLGSDSSSTSVDLTVVILTFGELIF